MMWLLLSGFTGQAIGGGKMGIFIGCFQQAKNMYQHCLLKMQLFHSAYCHIYQEAGIRMFTVRPNEFYTTLFGLRPKPTNQKKLHIWAHWDMPHVACGACKHFCSLCVACACAWVYMSLDACWLLTILTLWVHFCIFGSMCIQGTRGSVFNSKPLPKITYWNLNSKKCVPHIGETGQMKKNN